MTIDIVARLFDAIFNDPSSRRPCALSWRSCRFRCSRSRC